MALLQTNGQDWNQITFTKPVGAPDFEDFNFASSDAVNNTGNKNRVEVAVVFNAVSPDAATNPNNDPVGHNLKVQLESEVAPNVWVPLGVSDRQTVRSDDSDSDLVKFVVETRNPVDPEQGYNLGRGRIYYFSEYPGDKIRVCIIGREDQPTSPMALQNITVTGTINFTD